MFIWGTKSMASPSFTITGAAGPLLLRTATAAEALTATVDNLAGINSVSWSVVGTDETSGTYTLTTSGSYGSTVSWTAGSAGTCGILQCTINGGVNPQTGNVDDTMTATAKWSVPTSGALHVVAVGENNEHNPTYGWTGPVNAGIRAASGVAATTFADNTFYLYDNSDNTKHLALQLSGITTGTTRTWTVQDVDGVVSIVGATESITGAKTFGDGKLLLAGSSSGAMTLKAPAAASTYVATFPAATGTVSFIGLAETITGVKTFADSTVLLAGSSSGTTTLKATATASGVITLPAATGTVMLTSDLGAVNDSAFVLYDNGDPTKEAAFDCVSISAGNKRTFSFQDSSGTIALLEAVESITGAKTFGDGKLLLAGSSSGAMTLKAPAAASTYVATLPAATGTIDMVDFAATITAAKTFGDGNLKLAGSSSGTLTLKAPAAASTYVATLPAATTTLMGTDTTDTVTGKTFDTAGAGNVFKINGTTISAVTGSGSAALATSPTLTTPNIGVATATSVNKVAITAPATSATLTIADGTTFNVNVSSPVTNQILQYNGTSWVNANQPTTSILHRKPTADGAAGTAYSEKVIIELSMASTGTKVLIIPEGSVAANDTNYATITVRDGLAGSTIATANTKTVGSGGTGNWTVNVPINMGTLSDSAWAANADLTVEITKSGTGVTLPALTFQLNRTIP